MTELQQCEGTKDAWLRSVQDERFGKFIEEAHAFLHGAPTMQPGSILNGNVMFGNTKCTQRSSAAIPYLSFNQAFAETTRRHECSFCENERASRTLVASNGNDPRFQEAKFANAPALVLRIVILRMM